MKTEEETEGHEGKVHRKNIRRMAKIIGIRLGAPVESWTYEKIRTVYGTVDGYLADYHEFAADDDSNGPLFFLRALEDCKNSYDKDKFV